MPTHPGRRRRVFFLRWTRAIRILGGIMRAPVPGFIPFTDFGFTSSDGLRIACTRWESNGPSQAVFQIAHGMGEHIGRYLSLIEALVSSGFTVYGSDHRGHGRT